MKRFLFGTASVLAAICLVGLASAPALATAIGGTVTGGSAAANGGQFVKLTLPFNPPNGPANTVGNNTFQTNNLYVFDEGQNILVTQNLNVNQLWGAAGLGGPGTILAGTVVASHYVFFDPGPQRRVLGTVQFDSPILGVATSTANLAASDFLLNNGVTYLNPGLRGLEPIDHISWVGPNEIGVDWTASTPGDYVRVLTAFSPAAANKPPTCSLDGDPVNNITANSAFSFSVTGEDEDDDELTVTAVGLPAGATLSPPSGTTAGQPLTATFEWTPGAGDIGSSHVVIVTFTDPDGEESSCTFVVNVLNRAPECELDGDAENELTANVAFSTSVTGTDADGHDLTVTATGLPPGATLTPPSGTTAGQPLTATFDWTPGIGDIGTTHVVTVSFEDLFGETSTCTFTVEVVNRAPDCSSATPSIASIWPPNHKMVDVTIEGVTDPDGEKVTITITGITQDEPLNDTGDGNFEPDGAINGSVASVRAERLGGKGKAQGGGGPGNGRVYVIHFDAEDGSGGVCSGSVTVCVPHDQSGDPCVDDGQNYSSLGGAPKPVASLVPDVDIAHSLLKLNPDVWTVAPGNEGIGLSQNYPNPFNPITTIRYALAEDTQVRLSVYNAQGQLIRVLVAGGQGAGVHSVRWDGMDGAGRPVTSGIYVYRLDAGVNSVIRKMILLK